MARHQLLGRIFTIILSSIVVCGALQRGHAQAPDASPASSVNSKYAKLKVDSDLDKHDRTVGNMLQEKDIDQPKLLRNYLLWNFFARMTDPDKLSEIPEIYKTLFNRYFKNCSLRPVTMKKMNDLTHDIMLAISRGPLTARDAKGRGAQVVKFQNRYFKLNGTEVPAQLVAQTGPPTKDFHPAVKYNAMLILGDLNDKQPVMNVRRQSAAVPRVASLLPLLEVAESPDKNWSDLVRVAAMNGIKRRSNKDLESAYKKSIGNAMLNILKEKQPAGRSLDGDMWLRRQACEVLALLGTTGPNDSFLNALTLLISDENAPIEIRSAALGAISYIDLVGISQTEVTKILYGMGNLLVDGCNREIEILSRGQSSSSNRLMSVLVPIQAALGRASRAKPPADDAAPADPRGPKVGPKGGAKVAAVNPAAGIGLFSVAKKRNKTLAQDFLKIVDSMVRIEGSPKIPRLAGIVSRTEKFLDKVAAILQPKRPTIDESAPESTGAEEDAESDADSDTESVES